MPQLHAEVVSRMVFGNKVIDQERITGVEDAVIEVAAVYEVRDGKIAAAWFFSGG